MSRVQQIFMTMAVAAALWGIFPHSLAAETFAAPALLRGADASGVAVSEVRYPYRAYYRPYAAPYYSAYGYRGYGYRPYGGYGSYYRPYVTPYRYATPYYAARPYSYGYGPRPYYGGYYSYGRPRYTFGFGW
jgi:hypothetical protein